MNAYPIPKEVRERPRNELEDLIMEQRVLLESQGQTIAQLNENLTSVQTKCTAQLNVIRGNRTKLDIDVRDFMQNMGQPVAQKPTRDVSDNTIRMRLRLVTEEFFELLGSATDPKSKQHRWLAESLPNVIDVIGTMPIDVDLSELADACGDLDYVVEGLRQTMGIIGAEVHDEIHRANMQKRRENFREDGKIIKGPDFVPPDIQRVLIHQGWDGK